MAEECAQTEAGAARDDEAGTGGGTPDGAEEGEAADSLLRGFWDRRYEDGSAPEEWYCDSELLEPVLRWALGGPGAHEAHDGTQLLNIGCGTSDLCTRLAQGGYGGVAGAVHVVAVDVSLPALRARARGPEALLAADVTAMPFRDASFDAVLDKGTLDWIVLSLLVAEDRDARLAALRAELLRVLRPGGRLVVVTGLGGTSQDPAHFLGGRGPGWSGFQSRPFAPMESNYCCHAFVRAR